MNPLPNRSVLVLAGLVLALAGARYATDASAHALASHGALRWLYPRALLGMLLAPSPAPPSDTTSERDPAPTPAPAARPLAAPPTAPPAAPAHASTEIVPLCDTDARLLGAVQSTRSRDSFAMIAAPGSSSIAYHVGSPVLGQRLAAVGFDVGPGAFVILRAPDGALCLLGQNRPARAARTTAPPRGAPNTASRAAGSAFAAELAAGVTQLAPSVYSVRRDLLERALIDPTALTRTTRTEPILRDGRWAGVRLRAAVHPWPLDTLGLRDGDELTAVNGAQLDSPDAVLAALSTLRAGHATLSVRRGTTPLTLEYQAR